MTGTTRDVFLPISAQPSIGSHVEYARRAERLGYDGTWLSETWGRDAVSHIRRRDRDRPAVEYVSHPARGGDRPNRSKIAGFRGFS